LLEGIRCKYVSEDPLQKTPVGNNAPIEISGKVVEEVGFDKIRGQLAKLDGLKNVILTGLCIGTSTKVGEEDIGTVCPMIELIDLSRNLIDNFDEIVNICKNLPRMRTLKLKSAMEFSLDSITLLITYIARIDSGTLLYPNTMILLEYLVAWCMALPCLLIKLPTTSLL